MAQRLTYQDIELLCGGIRVIPNPLECCRWSMSALINPDESEETDTIAFDHIGLPDGRYILMSSIDSASGHFCEMFEAFICHQHDLQPTARAMRTTAREWFAAHNLSDIADTSTTWIMNLLAYANMRPWHVMQIQEGAHDWRPGSHV